MNAERLLRVVGVVVLGLGAGLVAYLIFDLVGGAGFAKAAAALVAVVAILSFAWAFS
jgi:hypothetical protein